jgi:hypothetical protein
MYWFEVVLQQHFAPYTNFSHFSEYSGSFDQFDPKVWVDAFYGTPFLVGVLGDAGSVMDSSGILRALVLAEENPNRWCSDINRGQDDIASPAHDELITLFNSVTDTFFDCWVGNNSKRHRLLSEEVKPWGGAPTEGTAGALLQLAKRRINEFQL